MVLCFSNAVSGCFGFSCSSGACGYALEASYLPGQLLEWNLLDIYQLVKHPKGMLQLRLENSQEKFFKFQVVTSNTKLSFKMFMTWVVIIVKVTWIAESLY